MVRGGGKEVSKVVDLYSLEIDNLLETKPSEEENRKRKEKEDQFWGASIPTDLPEEEKLK